MLYLQTSFPKVDQLIEWCLTPFSTVFQLYFGGQCTYPCFPGVLLTSASHDIPSKPLAAFPHTIVKATDSGRRGMNPVAMTRINPRKEYWPSRVFNQRPPVLKSARLPTELLGSAFSYRQKLFYQFSVLDSSFELGPNANYFQTTNYMVK